MERINKNYFVHESSVVENGATVGEGTQIWCFSHVLPEAIIGKNCMIGQNVFVDSNASIGNNCKVQNNVSIYKKVILEDDVFCGPSCVFTNVIDPRAFIERKHEFKETLVKIGATIGANAAIICGNTIGQYAMIGAGAVVTKDVPDYALIVGVPGKQKAWVCKDGRILTHEVFSSEKKELKCNNCGAVYEHFEGQLRPMAK